MTTEVVFTALFAPPAVLFWVWFGCPSALSWPCAVWHVASVMEGRGFSEGSQPPNTHDGKARNWMQLAASGEHGPERLTTALLSAGARMAMYEDAAESQKHGQNNADEHRSSRYQNEQDRIRSWRCRSAWPTLVNGKLLAEMAVCISLVLDLGLGEIIHSIFRHLTIKMLPHGHFPAS
ncbi:hypothetical protein B0T10DRAFT_571166 [Thelonectria olida]|uniref:Uncharacterized protein n=1 Tax=Thelonectria olida TaxID=1576542 RepID=A0A9P9AXA3_9HYPO|nr:hypothetical protein B0T10DRAFT_571166 [Thelonectria olida]